MNREYTFQSYDKKEVVRNHLRLGGKDNKGGSIDVTSQYIEKDGKPWIGITGEYHFSRDKRENWYHELCKIKAGGVNVVATYLFWIYHEEIEGQFNFEGDNDIRAFIEACERAKIDIIIRIGPWAHGECRNGGFPDWLLKKPYKLRDNNEGYMAQSRIWYTKIYEQVWDKFYKDGGPIIGVQLENELVNNGEHLLALKELAIEIGYIVPIYTVTGWNSKYGAKIPVDDVLPVFSAYAEAPWAKGTEPLSLSGHYVFDVNRNDSAVGMDIIKDTDSSGWRLPYEKYPYAMCELGSGLHPTYHRRPVITGMDAYSLCLTKLGSGNNLVGYYMYHGGVNQIGKLSTFNESKETGYPNDYPTLNYDFHTAITSYGEVREQYGLLNIVHLFLQDFGHILAPMETVLSKQTANVNDLASLRYAKRTDGESGFVFVNNYQRLALMEDIMDVVIDTGNVKFPSMDVNSNVCFMFPYNINLDLSDGNTYRLEYATAQLLSVVDDTYFFMAIDGIVPTYKFQDEEAFLVMPGHSFVVTYKKIKIVTLHMDEAIHTRKLDGSLYIGNNCNIYEADGRIYSMEEGSYEFLKWNGLSFERYLVEREEAKNVATFIDVEQPYVPIYERDLKLSNADKYIWKKVEVESAEGFLDIPFKCDVMQVYAEKELVADAYYNGEPLRIPNHLVYGKESYVVYTELQDTFYREF